MFARICLFNMSLRAALLVFEAKQSLRGEEIASDKEQNRPRNDIIVALLSYSHHLPNNILNLTLVRFDGFGQFELDQRTV